MKSKRRDKGIYEYTKEGKQASKKLLWGLDGRETNWQIHTFTF